MTILLHSCELVFDFLGDRVESNACGPHDDAGREFVFDDVSGGVFGCVPDSVFGNFGDAGVGYDVDFVVPEFAFCVVAYFLVISIEDVRLRLDDVY